MAPETAVIAIGVSCRFCSRNCAVTTISSFWLAGLLPGPGWLACPACAAACCSAGAGSAALWF
jgi:hypothetical protein